MFETPRPVPGRLVPALAGSAVVALALPVFLAAGWPLRGWLLAATLWIAGELRKLVRRWTTLAPRCSSLRLMPSYSETSARRKR